MEREAHGIIQNVASLKLVMQDVVTEETLRQLVSSFYDRVRRHRRLGPIFNDHVKDWAAHIETLTRFWSSLMLTSDRYKGNPFFAHQKLALS
jgi:truncated hemoglobin YjbI